MYFHHKLILVIEEILHQLIDSWSHYLQGFMHPRWWRISSINNIKAAFVWVVKTNSGWTAAGDAGRQAADAEGEHLPRGAGCQWIDTCLATNWHIFGRPNHLGVQFHLIELYTAEQNKWMTNSRVMPLHRSFPTLAQWNLWRLGSHTHSCWDISSSDSENH